MTFSSLLSSSHLTPQGHLHKAQVVWLAPLLSLYSISAALGVPRQEPPWPGERKRAAWHGHGSQARPTVPSCEAKGLFTENEDQKMLKQEKRRGRSSLSLLMQDRERSSHPNHSHCLCIPSSAASGQGPKHRVTA